MTPEDYARTERLLLTIARRMASLDLARFVPLASRAEVMRAHTEPGRKDGGRSLALRELAEEAREFQGEIQRRGLLAPFSRRRPPAVRPARVRL